MRSPILAGWLVLSASACGTASSLPRVTRPVQLSAQSAVIGPAATAAPRRASRARYSPRPSVDEVYSRRDLSGVLAMRFYAPIRNNADVRKTVPLGAGSVGMVEGGQRFVVSGLAARAIDTGDAPLDLQGVLQVPTSFGGGFLFFSHEAVFHAPDFDGALRRLGQKPVRAFVLTRDAAFLQLADGTTALEPFVAGARPGSLPPGTSDLRTHPNGFQVAFTAAADTLHVSADGRSWRKVPFTGALADASYPDGDAIVVLMDRRVPYRVTADGRLRADTATSEPWLKVMAARVPPPPSTAPTGGELWAHGWARSPRDESEWFTIRAGQLLVTRGGELRRVGPPSTAAGTCWGETLGRTAIEACASLAARLEVFRLDLDTGARTLERAVQVTHGVATFVGANRDAYPKTVFIAASCDGDPSGGFCVRGADGTFRSFTPAPWPRSTTWVFPDEVLYTRRQGDGGIDLARASTQEEVHFTAAQMAPIGEVLSGPASAAPLTEGLPFAFTGSLLRPRLLRHFHGPNPRRPLPPSPRSYALDFPTDGRPPVLREVAGVVVSAGEHALRLDGNRLYESSDGWDTWVEIEPPPTGVPQNLAGAMCNEIGCLFGAWVRLGWNDAATR